MSNNDKLGEAQRALEAMATLADDFGLPLGTSIEQVATHARFLQQERAKLLLSASSASVDGRRTGKHRLVYNKTTRTIDKVGADGLVVESFDPPAECP